MAEYTPSAALIKQIHDRLEKRANNSLRDQELTMMQVSVLLALDEAEEQQLSMKALERRFGVAQSTVAGIVSRLEQKGFVEARADADDRRVKLVHITRAGEDCCAEAAGRMDEAEEALLRGFSPQERARLNRLLMRIVANLE